MRRRTSLPWLLALAAAPAPLVGQIGKAPVAFVHVNVVPMDRERVLADHTVVVQDGRILAVGPAATTPIPPGALEVRGQNMYLMPGLAEMHAHIPSGGAPPASVARVLFLYLANGITTVRGMLGHASHLALKRRVEVGHVVGPRIYTSGPSLNGRSVPTPAAAVRAVEEQHRAGYDFLKIHPGIQRDVFDSLAATALRLEMRMAGHVPLDVGLARVLEAGYWSIDHLDGYAEALVGAGSPVSPKESRFFGLNLAAHLDEAGIADLARATRTAGVWNVPTESLIENLLGGDDPVVLAGRPEMRYVAQDVIDRWMDRAQGLRDEIQEVDRWRFIETRRRLIKALHEAGAGLLLGSDAPQVFNVPGFSIHRELALLVEAGLTPFEALQTGTVNVAAFLGSEAESGTVAVGKRADLILLEANPLEGITATGEVAGVMYGGRWLSPEAIAEHLETLVER